MYPEYQRRPLLVLLPLCLVFLLQPESVHACTCGSKPTVLEAFEEANVVIIARAISVEKVSEQPEEQQYVDGVRSTTMLVEKVFKGNVKVGDEIVFGQGGGANCIWTFDEESVGHEYLFYLYTASKRSNLWFAGGCGRSGGLLGARDDLLYLNKMNKVRGKTRISGTYGGWQNPDLDVEGKKIRIIGEKKTYETKTDKHGVYELYDLPPGKYLLEPQMPAGQKIAISWLSYSPSYSEAEVERPTRQIAFILEPKKHAGIDVSFEIDNVVSGSVLDPKGKPMGGVCAYLWEPKGGDEGWGSFDCTDENGRFKIESIPAGSYVLVINRDGKRSIREPFPRLFYPNVTEREKAAVITIDAGETIQDLNIVVPTVEEAIAVEGVLRYADGKPVAEEWVEFKAAETPGIDGDARAETDAEGRFSLKILKGLKGELLADFSASLGEYEDCPKLDDLIRKSGAQYAVIKTPAIKIEAEQDLYDAVLTFPFPACQRKH